MQEKIISLIEELLLSYDCVVIPHFGGFVLNTKDFTFDKATSTIHPKRKWVAFNERLKADDGVLAMALAQKLGLKQKEAFTAIHEFADALKRQIQAGEELTLGSVGTFSMRGESNINFEPNPETNFDLAQFGLLPVQIKSKTSKPTLLANPVVESMVDAEPIISEEVKGKRLSVKFYTYVLLAFVFGGTAAYFLTEPNSRYVNSSMSPLTIKIKKKEIVRKPIAEKPAPISIPEAKEASIEVPVAEGDIYLVAGSFLTEAKAALCQSELVSKGFSDVEIVEKGAGEKHFRVSVGRVANFDIGYQKAAELKKDKKLDIWVFKKQ
jgi:nucleoid DNA-binding protein